MMSMLSSLFSPIVHDYGIEAQLLKKIEELAARVERLEADTSFGRRIGKL